MIKLEKFDTMEVVKGRQVNRHLKSALETCRIGVNATVAPTQPPYGNSLKHKDPNDLKLKCLNVLTIFPGKIVKRTAAV